MRSNSPILVASIFGMAILATPPAGTKAGKPVLESQPSVVLVFVLPSRLVPRLANECGVDDDVDRRGERPGDPGVVEVDGAAGGVRFRVDEGTNVHVQVGGDRHAILARVGGQVARGDRCQGGRGRSERRQRHQLCGGMPTLSV